MHSGIVDFPRELNTDRMIQPQIKNLTIDKHLATQWESFSFKKTIYMTKQNKRLLVQLTRENNPEGCRGRGIAL